MTDISKREDEAMNALIAAAFRQGESDVPDLEKLPTQARYLTDEDREVLENLTPDFVQRITSNAWVPTERPSDAAEVEDEELLTAMNRGDRDAELTDEAKAEMERKLHELEDPAEDEEEDQG